MSTNQIIGAAVIIIAIAVYIKRKPLMATASKVVSILTRPQFIEQYTDTVKKAAKGTGLFPSLFMAQAILESADKNGNPGNSTLAKAPNNNFFGIKADNSWAGAKVLLPTREVINGVSTMVNAAFRKYASPLASFNDRVAFLQKNSRYTKAGVFTAKTPEDQAKALQTAGYATDPNYASTLISVINKYGLKSLDS